MGKAKVKTKKRNTKINLVFNEEKRREFLSGFHKRKLQRKKKAKDQLEKQLLEEKKRLKSEAKESYKKLVKSYATIPEVEHLLADEYEDDDVNVRVIELSTNEIAKQNHWIGANQPLYTTEDAPDSPSEDSDSDDVPGMHLKPQAKPNKDVKSSDTSKTKGQLKHFLKRQATKNIQKSVPFQIKNKLERQKQKKKSNQEKRVRIKLQNKKNSRKGFRGKNVN